MQGTYKYEFPFSCLNFVQLIFVKVNETFVSYSSNELMILSEFKLATFSQTVPVINWSYS